MTKFVKGQVLTLKPNWREIDCNNGFYTYQLEDNQADTEYTVTRSRTDGWVSVQWEAPFGVTKSNCFDPAHFQLAAQPQTTEELLAENKSLAAQIDKLTARRLKMEEELATLVQRIQSKHAFYQENAANIKANIPEEVLQYAPYM